jgi:hypothetical protein
MGKCSFGGDEILDFTFLTISLEVLVGFWKRGIHLIARSMAIPLIPLLLVMRLCVVLTEIVNVLDAVGDLIVALVLDFFMLLSVLMRFFFIGLCSRQMEGFFCGQ